MFFPVAAGAAPEKTGCICLAFTAAAAQLFKTILFYDRLQTVISSMYAIVFYYLLHGVVRIGQQVFVPYNEALW